MPARTSPPARRMHNVMSAKTRSESVSPLTIAKCPPSRCSSRSRSPTTPLCANTRPSCRNGCVLGSRRSGDGQGTGTPPRGARRRGRCDRCRPADQQQRGLGAQCRDPEAVGVDLALCRERCRRLQEPEVGLDVMRPGVECEQTAHARRNPTRRSRRSGRASCGRPRRAVRQALRALSGSASPGRVGCRSRTTRRRTMPRRR